VIGGCVGARVGEGGDVGIGLRYTSHRLLGLPIELELPCLEVGLLRLLAERDAAFEPHLCRRELAVEGATLGHLRLQATPELLRCGIATGFGVLNLFACAVGGATTYAGGVLRDAHVEVSRLFQAGALGLVVCAVMLVFVKPRSVAAVPVRSPVSS